MVIKYRKLATSFYNVYPRLVGGKATGKKWILIFYVGDWEEGIFRRKTLVKLCIKNLHFSIPWISLQLFCEWLEPLIKNHVNC